MPHVVYGHEDEDAFENAKIRYQKLLTKQISDLRKCTCPIIGKPCIGCDCLAYREPVAPYKSLTGELPLERWISKILNVPFVEPYYVYYWLARCNKGVFEQGQFQLTSEDENP